LTANLPEVTRSSWAGVRIDGGATILIDPLIDPEPLSRLGMGAPRRPLVAPSVDASVDCIAVTHVHPDHCDPSAWRRTLRPGGRVVGPPAVIRVAAKAGFEGRALGPWEVLALADRISLTALPAVDGFGEEQVSWLVRIGSWSLFHGGDTLWHGHWWSIAKRCGAPSMAFLPINGAVTAFEGVKPSPLPATMTPEEAVVAAHLLGAARLIPIHYGEFHRPPVYIEAPNAIDRLMAAAERHELRVDVVAAGEVWEPRSMGTLEGRDG